jgi:ABC-2 type transport system permease protein
VTALPIGFLIPLGITVGSLVPDPRAIALFVLPFGGLTAISGIFYPITHLPGWLQGIGQVFPKRAMLRAT